MKPEISKRRADQTPDPARLDLRSAALLSGILWSGHFAVSATSSLAATGASTWNLQAARFLVALAGFGSCLGIHLAMPKGDPEEFWRTFGKALAICVPVAAALTIYSYYQFAWFSVEPSKSGGRLLTDFAFSYAYYLWIFISWTALYTGFATVREALERHRRAAQFEAVAVEAQLRALRYQLNPHFFFNVLNTLSGLISRSRLSEAESVIVNMADFLRYSLTGSPSELVALEAEIAAQLSYLQIEKVRFGERLQLSVDIPADCENAAVPALILQPLLENAVKHGIGRSDLPVPIAITASCTAGRLTCTVENGAVAGEGAPDGPGLGVGLGNVAERLRVFYGDQATLSSGPVEGGGWRSAITLPLRRI